MNIEVDECEQSYSRKKNSMRSYSTPTPVRHGLYAVHVTSSANLDASLHQPMEQNTDSSEWNETAGSPTSRCVGVLEKRKEREHGRERKKMQRISQGDQRYYGHKKRSALRDMVCRRGFLIT